MRSRHPKRIIWAAGFRCAFEWILAPRSSTSTASSRHLRGDHQPGLLPALVATAPACAGGTSSSHSFIHGRSGEDAECLAERIVARTALSQPTDDVADTIH